MSETRTHYRKAFNSPYLSSADIVDPVILTISHVKLEADHTKQTKDEFNTAYFVEKFIRPGEPLKPMVLNATNSKFLADVTGAKFIEDWRNISVEVRVEQGIKFGRDTVEGLRLGKPPAQARSVPQAVLDAGEQAAKAGTAALQTWWQGLDKGTRQLLATQLKAWKAQALTADQAAKPKAD